MSKSTTIGLTLMSSVLLAYLIYGVMRCKFSQYFGEFNDMLIKDSSFSIFSQIIYFYFGIIVSALYFQFYSFPYISLAVLVFTLLLYVLTLLKPIFRKNIDKYRTQLNLLTVAMLQIPGIYLNIETSF